MSNPEKALNITDIMIVQSYGTECDSFKQKIFMHVGLKRLRRGQKKNDVSFEALIAFTVTCTVFWNVIPHSLIELYLYFRRISCLHLQG
jgi:hypothetical protein